MEYEYIKTFRNEILIDVWSHPLSKVCYWYNLTEAGLINRCKKYLIPLPSVETLNSIMAGNIVNLPVLKPLTNSRIFYNYPHAKISTDEIEMNAVVRNHLETISETLLSFSCPDKLTNPHPLIASTIKFIKNNKDWSSHKGYLSAPGQIINIEVTKSSIDRAMLILDSLFKSLEIVGIYVCFKPEDNKTVLCLDGLELPITLTEHVSRKKHIATPAENRASKRYWDSSRIGVSHIEYPRIPDYDYIPTGRLHLNIGQGSQRTWSDGKISKLKNRLGEIIRDIFILSGNIRGRENHYSRRNAETQRKRDIYDAAINLRNNEVVAVKKLTKMARRWRQAEQIRDFLVAYKQTYVVLDLNPEQREWLSWANDKADWLDPLIQVSDILLDAPPPIKSF